MFELLNLRKSIKINSVKDLISSGSSLDKKESVDQIFDSIFSDKSLMIEGFIYKGLLIGMVCFRLNKTNSAYIDYLIVEKYFKNKGFSEKILNMIQEKYFLSDISYND